MITIKKDGNGIYHVSENLPAGKEVVRVSNPSVAYAMNKSFSVDDGNSESIGMPGDYLILKTDGSYFVCRKEKFEKMYRFF